jgi:spermidine/putrescine-binding protein
MFMKNKDKIIGAILAKVEKPKEEEPEKEYEMGSEDLEVAAEEVLQAIKTRDVSLLAEALKYFVNACKEEEE